MKVARWGNSLAVRLPRNVAEALSLKEGDEVTLRAAHGVVEVCRDGRRDAAVARLREYAWPVPLGLSFDRAEIYDEPRSGAPEKAGPRE